MQQTTHGERWPSVLLRLAAASCVCIALVLLRVLWTGEPDYMFLVWNLALAWAPFVLAIGVYGSYRHGASAAWLIAPGILWLLFLPNAPYLITDFVHLPNGEGVPLWFDALALAAYAGTGLLLGFASLYLMQAVAVRALGERAIWWCVVAVLTLSSVGIYLGRFQRLNSWDALRDPRLILGMARERLQAPLDNPTLITVTVVFTAFLSFAYLLAYALVAPRREAEEEPQAARR